MTGRLERLERWLEGRKPTLTPYAVSFTVQTETESVRLRGTLLAPGPLAILTDFFAIEDVAPKLPPWVCDGVRAELNGHSIAVRYVVPKQDGGARLFCYVEPDKPKPRRKDRW